MQSMSDIILALVMPLLNSKYMPLDHFNGQVDGELPTDTQLYCMVEMIGSQFSGDIVAFFEMVEMDSA